MATLFDSQHCYLQTVQYTIDEFQQLDRASNVTPTDVNGNVLTLCEGSRIKPYFRRNRGHYEPMTEWHSDWQSHFSDSKERTFSKTDHEGQHSDRRADVDLNDAQVIEFQHSSISYDEVSARRMDYCAIGKDIIWVVDGQDGVVVHPLHARRVFLEFPARWKYKAFRNYDCVYLNIGEFVYRLFPKKVRSHMLDVEAPVTKTDFITGLTAGVSPFQTPPITPPQSRLFVKQQGAGNGKTYGIVQLIRQRKFAHYNTFVYLTKQHSAVHVIRREIADQRAHGMLPGIVFGEMVSHGKKTVLPFRVQSDTDATVEWRHIIVGTFDSFVYSLARHDVKGIDKFQDMVNSIVADEILGSCAEGGTLKYAGQIRLNKRLLLVGDEMQDLTENYGKAVIRIMRDWYVDFYAVGDRLQSISMERNAFTYFAVDVADDDPDECTSQRFPNIDIQRPEPHNICRRFIHPELVTFVNTVVDFDTFALPSIEPYHVLTADEAAQCEKPLTVFGGKTVYADSKNEEDINAQVDGIMKHYAYEVETHARRPEDFLIVTPFVRKNPLVEALHQRIRNYWSIRTADDDAYDNNKYYYFSFFHKSEEGTSIDLSESEDCTRIVSIHSSKGDGRKVVFVIGITESALKLYSNDTGNLVYNSLWHVALTRMKEKLYIRLEPNGDDIHRRVQSYEERTGYEMDIEPKARVGKNLRLSQDLLRIDQDKTFRWCYDRIICDSEQHEVDIDNYGAFESSDGQSSPKRIIDMKHHEVRYAAMVVQSFLAVIRLQRCLVQIDECTSMKRQMYAVLKKIAYTEVIECSNGRKYWSLLTDRDKNYIPIRRRQGGEYEQHYIRIYASTQRVQHYLKQLLASHDHSSTESHLTHMDFVVLFHMIEVEKRGKYTRLPISDLYDLFDNEHKATQDEKKLYVDNHYRDMKRIDALWEQFFATNGSMNILYAHPVFLHSESTTDLSVREEIPFLAYTSTTVIPVLIKPQFTALNYNETLFHSIFTTNLLQNLRHDDHPEQNGANYERFGNADTHRHCVLTLSFPSPYYIDWKHRTTGSNLIATHSSELSEILRSHMKMHFARQSAIVRRWYNYTRSGIPSGIRNKVSPAIDHVLQAYDTLETNQGGMRQNARFVRGALDAIKTRVSDFKPKKQRLNHLLTYDDKDTFIELLDSRKDEAVDGFFGVDSESDTDSDTDSDEDRVVQ